MGMVHPRAARARDCGSVSLHYCRGQSVEVHAQTAKQAYRVRQALHEGEEKAEMKRPSGFRAVLAWPKPNCMTLTVFPKGAGHCRQYEWMVKGSSIPSEKVAARALEMKPSKFPRPRDRLNLGTLPFGRPDPAANDLGAA